MSLLEYSKLVIITTFDYLFAGYKLAFIGWCGLSLIMIILQLGGMVL